MAVPIIDVSDFVNVSVAFTPLSVPFANFGTLMIMGDSNVIDTVERQRIYTTIAQVTGDFASTTPEYAAATLFFSQSPRPAIVYIGRWASAPTSGILHGAALTATQQLLANFTAITIGSLRISIDGVFKDVSNASGSPINFSAALNMNGVAAILQTSLRISFTPALVNVTWDASIKRFNITSSTTGVASTVSYGATILTIGATTDISVLMGLTLASGASPLVIGQLAETPLNAVIALATATSAWYGLMDATTVPLVIADYVAIAAYILASSRSRIFMTTIMNTAAMDPTQTADLASVLQSLNNRRVGFLFSTYSAVAVATMFGRGFTVDFNANQSTITLAYKQAPGLQGENITETQFATIIAKGGNVNIKVNNGAIMLWNGQMSQGYWFDEVQGVDWLQNRIQTYVFNLLYTTTTKVPQTDDGDAMISAAIAQGCEDGVNNGLIAPGQWNAAPFGMLKMGSALSKGYYIYYPPIATQAENLRQQRVSVPFQVAAKMAGAVQIANVLLNINP